jgi:hypothetical protein
MTFEFVTATTMKMTLSGILCRTLAVLDDISEVCTAPL